MTQTAKSEVEAYSASLEAIAETLASQAVELMNAGLIDLGEATLEQPVKLRDAIERLRAIDL
ncbi:hypothetical protein [Pseudomonas sp. VS38]|uniref:hypothetical protein n=1 Tax=Pseudomonas sp. VS38 TaxID=2834066 RepID=UPI001BDE68A2|nr:hypothetical protein [Pseudomonas sp. VS38]MBT1266404.1 hypothetical protein [Pseudomonas sp. VS38]